jgi:hypothetical protein
MEDARIQTLKSTSITRTRVCQYAENAGARLLKKTLSGKILLFFVLG